MSGLSKETIDDVFILMRHQCVLQCVAVCCSVLQCVAA